MYGTERAIEVQGTINRHSQLVLDEPLPVKGPAKVRVIVLLAEQQAADEDSWLHAAARNPAFAFLRDPAEDIYTLHDGHAFYQA